MRAFILASVLALVAAPVLASGVTVFSGGIGSHSASNIGSALSNNASSYQAFSGNVGEATVNFTRNRMGVTSMNESAFGETGWRNRRSGGAEAYGNSGGGIDFRGFRR